MIDLYYWQYSRPIYPEGEHYFSGFYKAGDRRDLKALGEPNNE